MHSTIVDVFSSLVQGMSRVLQSSGIMLAGKIL